MNQQHRRLFKLRVILVLAVLGLGVLGAGGYYVASFYDFFERPYHAATFDREQWLAFQDAGDNECALRGMVRDLQGSRLRQGTPRTEVIALLGDPYLYGSPMNGCIDYRLGHDCSFSMHNEFLRICFGSDAELTDSWVIQ